MAERYKNMLTDRGAAGDVAVGLAYESNIVGSWLVADVTTMQPTGMC